KALEGLVELLAGGLLGQAVDLGHQEDLLAVAILQGLAHADLAAAVVVIPAVVHEGDAGVDGGADDLDTVFLLLLAANVVTAQADNGYVFARAPERAVAHLATDRFLRPFKCGRPAGVLDRRH